MIKISFINSNNKFNDKIMINGTDKIRFVLFFWFISNFVAQLIIFYERVKLMCFNLNQKLKQKNRIENNE